MIKRATVPVLCYHQLRDWRTSDSAYNRGVLICPPARFRDHLDALASDGWTTIGPDDYLAHLRTGSELPAKPVILSFDDAQGSQISEGLPQLRKREMTGTFFVMTVVLGQRSWMSRNDVKKLDDAGMTIGSHTWDHHPVTGYSGRDWKTQLQQSRETLEKIIKKPVRHLAYPYGSWNRVALPHVAAAGYRTAFQLAEKKLNRTYPELTLRRILVNSAWTGKDMLNRLEGKI
jgi:peptidoglycan/xylan/chitin deacetylase (PgdA/CDA1 family)